ncbi:AAA domain-containing protein [Auraticoccus sp. F435]|uniref:AAA domain-containing protein n=1 Tax=Auraticoccus cholistanensis TaxID=2656650 RepID=A0A6A9URW1_9ACTN|nr:MoxR family ATPase [Auraticoccus cholistanensis]MVA75441.1 AAA domain-containing protein [Auraticoccus cholistanensis]
MSTAEAAAACARVLDQVERAVVGKRRALELVLTGVVAGGHVLLEDFPGLGKTLAARSFAQALGLDFRRAQFTPDLLPSDLTGSYVYDQRRAEFDFRPGPLFAGLLLADEINRTPPKTQAALLEAMQERQVTVEGVTHPLPRPFHVLATANPIETEGTYPLPEAQLDRFLLRLQFGYPEPEEEWEVLSRRISRRAEEQRVDAVLDAAGLAAVQQAAEDVFFHPEVGRYAIAVTTETRRDSALLVGASPRGSLALLTCARAHALIQGRSYVTPADVKALAVAALAHRVTVRPELWMSNVTGEKVVAAVLDRVPVPTEYSPEP